MLLHRHQKYYLLLARHSRAGLPPRCRASRARSGSSRSASGGAEVPRIVLGTIMSPGVRVNAVPCSESGGDAAARCCPAHGRAAALCTDPVRTWDAQSSVREGTKLHAHIRRSRRGWVTRAPGDRCNAGQKESRGRTPPQRRLNPVGAEGRRLRNHLRRRQEGGTFQSQGTQGRTLQLQFSGDGRDNAPEV